MSMAKDGKKGERYLGSKVDLRIPDSKARKP